MKRMMAAVVAVGMLSIVGRAEQAPPPPPPPPSAPTGVAGAVPVVGTATIRGRVVEAGTGEPVAGVRVVVAQYRALTAPITATPIGALVAMSNTGGEFEVAGVPAGRVMVGATKSGYVAAWYAEPFVADPPVSRPRDRDAPSDSEPAAAPRPIDVRTDAIIEGVEIAIARGGVIAGAVVDSDGEPVVGASVQALRPQGAGDDRRLVADVTAADVTDERGQFRLHGLPSGRFALAASAGGELPARRPDEERTGLSGGVGAAHAFFPAADVPEFAELVEAVPGQEVAGLTILFAPRLAAITGRVLNADGQPGGATFLVVEQPSDAAAGGRSSRTYRIAADGTFSIGSLPPGRYIVRVPATQGNGVARADVELAGADLDVTLTLEPGRTLRGRVLFDAAVTADTRVMIVARAAEPDRIPEAGATIITTGEFVLSGLSGLVHLTISAPGWKVRSMRQGSAELMEPTLDLSGGDIDGLEIVLTRDTSGGSK